MKRGFCKSRTPTSKAQTGTKHVLQSPRAWRRHEKHSQSHARAFQTGATSFNGLEDVGGGFAPKFPWPWTLTLTELTSCRVFRSRTWCALSFAQRALQRNCVGWLFTFQAI